MNDMQLFGLSLLGMFLIIVGLGVLIFAPLFRSTPLGWFGGGMTVLGMYLRFKFKRGSGIIIHRG